MGKYAFYILAAYGVSALTIAVMIADTWLRARRWRAEVRRLEQALGKTGTES
jgi:heme exporter protein CcmD